MNERINHIKSALEAARAHHNRATEELLRWQEPTNGDHRNTLTRLLDDCRKAENDVAVLESELHAALHSYEAFEV